MSSSKHDQTVLNLEAAETINIGDVVHHHHYYIQEQSVQSLFSKTFGTDASMLAAIKKHQEILMMKVPQNVILYDQSFGKTLFPFVCPKMHVYNMKKESKWQRAVSLEDIPYMPTQNRFIGIIGPPGSGKTTVSKQLAKIKPNRLATFVHSFADLRYNESLTYKQLFIDFPCADLNEVTKENAFQWMVENQDKCVFVFDGYDQATWSLENIKPLKASYDTPLPIQQLVANLCFKTVFKKSLLIFTSHPHSMLKLPPDLRPDITIHVDGLSTDHMKRLLYKCAEERADEIWEMFTTRGAELMELAHNPLLLQFIVFAVLHQGSNQLISITEVLQSVLLRYSKYAQGTDINKLWEPLGQMAYEGMQQETHVFTEIDLNKKRLDVTVVQDVIIAFARNLGHPTQRLFEDDLQFSFAHQLFQYMFAAKYICSFLSDEEFHQIIHRVIKENHWAMVRRFLCGLLLGAEGSSDVHQMPYGEQPSVSQISNDGQGKRGVKERLRKLFQVYKRKKVENAPPESSFVHDRQSNNESPEKDKASVFQNLLIEHIGNCAASNNESGLLELLIDVQECRREIVESVARHLPPEFEFHDISVSQNVVSLLSMAFPQLVFNKVEDIHGSGTSTLQVVKQQEDIQQERLGTQQQQRNQDTELQQEQDAQQDTQQQGEQDAEQQGEQDAEQQQGEQDAEQQEGEQNAEQQQGEQDAEQQQEEQDAEQQQGRDAEQQQGEGNAEQQQGEQDAEQQQGEQDAEQQQGREDAEQQQGEQDAEQQQGEQDAELQQGEQNAEQQQGEQDAEQQQEEQDAEQQQGRDAEQQQGREDAEQQQGEQDAEQQQGREDAEQQQGREDAEQQQGERNAEQQQGEQDAEQQQGEQDTEQQQGREDAEQQQGEQDAEQQQGREDAEQQQGEQDAEQQQGREDAEQQQGREDAEQQQGEQDAEQQQGEQDAEQQQGRKDAEQHQGEQDAEQQQGEQDAEQQQGREDAEQQQGEQDAEQHQGGQDAEQQQGEQDAEQHQGEQDAEQQQQGEQDSKQPQGEQGAEQQPGDQDAEQQQGEQNPEQQHRQQGEQDARQEHWQAPDIVIRKVKILAKKQQRITVGRCVVEIPENAVDTDVEIKLTCHSAEQIVGVVVIPLLICEPPLLCSEDISITLPTCFMFVSPPQNAMAKTSCDGKIWRKKKIDKNYTQDDRHFTFSTKMFSRCLVELSQDALASDKEKLVFGGFRKEKNANGKQKIFIQTIFNISACKEPEMCDVSLTQIEFNTRFGIPIDNASIENPVTTSVAKGSRKFYFKEEWLIGEGLASKVYICKDSNEKDLLAVKRVVLKSYPNAEKELETLCSLRGSKYLLSYITHEKTDDYLEIYTELCEGCVDQFVECCICQCDRKPEEEWPRPLTTEAKDLEMGIKIKQDYLAYFDLSTMDVAKQMIEGIYELHNSKKGYVHRDIKPSNFLLQKPPAHDFVIVKVCDFGLTRNIDPRWSTKPSGTASFKPPEVLICEQAEKKIEPNPKSDVFSLGLVLFYTYTKGKHPYGKTLNKQNCNIEEKIKPTFDDLNGTQLDEEIKINLRGLLQWMLQPELKDRPTMKEVKCHPMVWSYQEKVLFLEVVANLTDPQRKQEAKAKKKLIKEQVKANKEQLGNKQGEISPAMPTSDEKLNEQESIQHDGAVPYSEQSNSQKQLAVPATFSANNHQVSDLPLERDTSQISVKTTPPCQFLFKEEDDVDIERRINKLKEVFGSEVWSKIVSLRNKNQHEKLLGKSPNSGLGIETNWQKFYNYCTEGTPGLLLWVYVLFGNMEQLKGFMENVLEKDRGPGVCKQK